MTVWGQTRALARPGKFAATLMRQVAVHPVCSNSGVDVVLIAGPFSSRDTEKRIRIDFLRCVSAIPCGFDQHGGFQAGTEFHSFVAP